MIFYSYISTKCLLSTILQQTALKLPKVRSYLYDKAGFTSAD